MSSSTYATSAPRGAVLNLLRRLHFYIGLFIAPFIFIAALTGTLYVLTPQIENLLYAEALTAQPQGTAHSLAEQIAVARRYAGQQTAIYAVRPAPNTAETTRVQFADPALGPSESRAIFIDPYSLAIKGDMTVYGTSGILPLRTWLDQLHRGLLLGDIGRNYSELAASWLWVAALGGVLLWWENRPRRRVKMRPGGAAATRYQHMTLGLLLLGGLLFFSATGLTWSQWAGGNIDKLRSELGWLTPQVKTALVSSSPVASAGPHAEHHAAMMPGMDMSAPSLRSDNPANGDWDRVLQVARQAGIRAAKVELRPASANQAWTVTEVDRSWPTRVDAVSVNPHNFNVMDQVRFANFPLVAKLTRWGVDAHMGILFGWPNQLLLALFGVGLCAMIVLGYRLWWLRRPAAAPARSLQTLITAWQRLALSGKIVSLLLALTLGYLLPTMGVSLLAFLLIDTLRGQQHQRRSAAGFVPQTRFFDMRKETRRFISAIVIVLLTALVVMTRVMIGGAMDEYHIPFSDWTAEMYVTQGLMILVYSCVFTGLLSIPLWYWFLGEKESEQA
ncbi:hypothetical protein PMPD1_2192 [Paramixta manurensis]|uniref:DUF2534 family protein n=1 Tax=Paramixta manurensis TaxID=2740817 RepID=A0A6M8UFA4_9GAMM|nr:hypothetical protein PMPD1_2192 [Erwiniaceae bacterium PD-1]